MTDLAVPLGLALIVAVFLGVAFFRKRRQADLRNDPVAGEVAYPGGTLEPAAWYIPRLKGFGEGGIVSPGMPVHPEPAPGGGWLLHLPQPGQELDAVLFNPGPLTGKRQIRMRYSIEKDAGVELLAVSPGGFRMPALMTMFVKRKGDDWSGQGEHVDDRWYSTFAPVRLEEGEHEMIVPLDGAWTSLVDAGPVAFADALANCDALGPVFGGNEDSWAHGMYATGPARLIVTAFEVS
jgi:hypothetical protein